MKYIRTFGSHLPSLTVNEPLQVNLSIACAARSHYIDGEHIFYDLKDFKS